MICEGGPFRARVGGLLLPKLLAFPFDCHSFPERLDYVPQN
jgi:hypothetical protein